MMMMIKIMMIWQVGALPAGALVEIELLAVSGQLETTYVTEEWVMNKQNKYHAKEVKERGKSKVVSGQLETTYVTEEWSKSLPKL